MRPQGIQWCADGEHIPVTVDDPASFRLNGDVAQLAGSAFRLQPGTVEYLNLERTARQHRHAQADHTKHNPLP